MAEHSGGDFAVRAQVNIQRVSFHSVCYTADTSAPEKRKGGNINYQVVKRDTVNTRGDAEREEKGI